MSMLLLGAGGPGSAPPAPTSFLVISQYQPAWDGDLSLWTPIVELGGESYSEATAYNLYRANSLSGPWEFRDDNASFQFFDAITDPTQTYYYRATAVVDGVESLPSDVVTVPAAPATTAEATGYDVLSGYAPVDLTGEAPAAPPGSTDWDWYWSTDGSAWGDTYVSVAEGEWTAANPGTLYYLTANYRDANNNLSLWSVPVVVGTAVEPPTGQISYSDYESQWIHDIESATAAPGTVLVEAYDGSSWVQVANGGGAWPIGWLSASPDTRPLRVYGQWTDLGGATVDGSPMAIPGAPQNAEAYGASTNQIDANVGNATPVPDGSSISSYASSCTDSGDVAPLFGISDPTIDHTVTAYAIDSLGRESLHVELVVLAQPQSLDMGLSNETLTWDAVSGAVDYDVESDGAGDVASPSIPELDLQPFGADIYRLRANNNLGSPGLFSVDFTLLAAPQNLQLTGSIISWDAVTDAYDYAVYKDGFILEGGISVTEYDTSVSGSGNYQVRAFPAAIGSGLFSGSIAVP